jgi:hypothetical protein
MVEAARECFPCLRVRRRQCDADKMAAHLRDDHGAVESDATEIDAPSWARSGPATDRDLRRLAIDAHAFDLRHRVAYLAGGFRQIAVRPGKERVLRRHED